MRKNVLITLFIFITMLVFTVSKNEISTVKIGIYDNKPKIFLDDSNRPAGFFPELLENIFEKKGIKTEFIYGSWEDCLEKLGKGDLDIMPDVR